MDLSTTPARGEAAGRGFTERFTKYTTGHPHGAFPTLLRNVRDKSGAAAAPRVPLRGGGAPPAQVHAYCAASQHRAFTWRDRPAIIARPACGSPFLTPRPPRASLKRSGCPHRHFGAAVRRASHCQPPPAGNARARSRPVTAAPAGAMNKTLVINPYNYVNQNAIVFFLPSYKSNFYQKFDLLANI